MEIKGKLKAIQPIIERSNFKSRRVWLTTEENSQYPQTIEIELAQDKVNLFDDIAIGFEVTASCNLRGREWVDKEGVTKVFNTITCWKINPSSSPGGVKEEVHVKSPDDQSLPF